MRQNFDFVSMDDYEKDMAEATERSLAIIESLRQQRDEAEGLLFALVAHKGEVRIPYGYFEDAQKGRISRHCDDFNQEHVFRIVEPPATEDADDKRFNGIRSYVLRSRRSAER